MIRLPEPYEAVVLEAINEDGQMSEVGTENQVLVEMPFKVDPLVATEELRLQFESEVR